MAEFSLEEFTSEKPPAKAPPSTGKKTEFSLEDFGGTSTPSKDKTSTQTLSNLVTGKQAPQTTGVGTFAREAALGVPATAAAITAAETVGGMAAPVMGPWAAIPAVVAGGATAFGVNYLGEAGMDELEAMGPVAQKIMQTLGVDKATREAGRKEHEYMALSGQLASGAPFISPATAATSIGKSFAQRGVSGTIQAGIGAGQRAATGENQDLGKTLLEFGGGALMPGKLTKLGEKVVPSKFKPKETIAPPPEGATPEQKAEYLAKLKKIKAERDAKAPLVEAAIRNKETGEIERMGPKHDPQRKIDTADTHDQGFVDERGNFHERLDAVDQAKRAGQIPQDHVLENPPGEQPGLHSGDLRKVGDERFKITEDQPPSEPKPPTQELKAPVTRQEHKDVINNLEEQAYLHLEIQRQEALNTGDKAAANQIAVEQNRLEQQIADLNKSMPSVVFKNKELPTWEELHDHLFGSKNVGQAFDSILSTDGLGTKGQRALLKVLNQSKFIRDANLEFSNEHLKFIDEKGKEQNAAGMYTGGDVHLVQLAKDGDIRALAHEAMHAGTQRLIDMGNSVAATKLKDLQEKFLAEHNRRYQEALEQFQRDNIAPTIAELKAFEKANRKPYGFTNAHEFVAEAFTNRDFKEILASIKSTEPGTGVLSNMWQEFKNIVREGLNIPKGERTAFDDALEYGAALVEESKGFQRDSSGTVTLLPSKLSEEIHNQLEREGIPVAHSSRHRFGMFNWVKHALTGEGGMVFGAGTYHSTKDSTDRFYYKQAKEQALREHAKQNPEMWKSIWKADAEIDSLNRQINSIDQYTDSIEQDLLPHKYEMNRSYEDFVKEFSEFVEVDSNDPTIKKYYEESISESKQAFNKLQQTIEQNKQRIKEKKEQITSIEKRTADIKDKIDKEVLVPTYHSTIKAKPEEFLDWNAIKQSDIVNRAFKNLGIETDISVSKKEIDKAINSTDWYGSIEEDGFTAISVLGRDYKISFNEATYHPDGTLKIDKYVVELTGELVDTLDKAKASVIDEIYRGQGIYKTGEQLYRELSKKFEPTNQKNITKEEAQHIGDVKASMALAEQGVVGNVHNSQGGKETKYRNYVVFDDSRTQQNLTTLASKVIETTGEIVGETAKPDPRNVKDEKEFLEIATDIYEKHGDVEAIKFFEGWQQFKKTWAEPVKEVEKFVGINLNSKIANERIVHNNTSDIKELAGKDVNLEQLTYDIDKGATLTGKAKEVATKFRELMDELGKRALENDVIKGWHENYVARNVVTEGAAPKGALEEFMRDAFGYGEKASGDGTKTTTKYGQERRLKTREDLVNHIHGINSWLESKGLDYRFKLKTDNLAEIYKDYALSVEKAIENKSLIDNIKQIRNVNGESLIKPITDAQPLPYGWKQIDHPDLAGYAIHPDLVAPLKFVFDSGPGMTMQALGTISQAVKRINVIGSFFHAKSLMEVLSSAKIPLWTPFKEAIVLPAVEFAVKKTTGKDLQLSAISKAVEQYKKGGLGDNVDKWIREDGLQLEVPEDVSKGMLSAVGKFADTMIGKYGPKTRILEKSMSTIEKYTLGVFDKYTWDYLHTGGKIMVADAYLEKARLQAAKDGKPFDESVSRKEIAKFVNDSFGGLNWFDAARNTQNEFAKRIAMAAYSPEGRRSLQVMLFAPDWTISTLRAFSSALPKSLNPTKWQPVEGIKGMLAPTTKADYARLYQFKTAMVYLTLLNVINNMTAGRNIWDNKDPTRIEWPDGTSMQAMKHAMEPYHWIMDPDKTLSNKLGFIPKAAVVGIGGLEYASPTAEKLVDLSGTGRLKAVAKTALPFQLQAGGDAPEGEGVKRALLGTAGFPVYGSTPEQRKQKKKERDEARKASAAAYHKKAKEKGWEK